MCTPSTAMAAQVVHSSFLYTAFHARHQSKGVHDESPVSVWQSGRVSLVRIIRETSLFLQVCGM